VTEAAAADQTGHTEKTRLTTSTRDRANMRARLQEWLTATLPDGAGPQISDLVAPANGLSSETVLFDVAWTESGRRRDESLVARIAPEPSAVPVFPVYDLGREYRTMALVADLSPVPVPELLWNEPDADPLGAPFFVMRRVEGVVPPDNVPYCFAPCWLSDASPEEQRRLQTETVRTLAALHAILDAPQVFAYLDPGGEGSGLRRHVEQTRRYHDWVMGDARSPLLDRSFAWLEEHWPEEESPATLSWGDSRIGNVMYRDFQPVAVFDWEMASIAPPEVDLGWLVFWHRFFQDLAERYGLAGMPGFMRLTDVIETYREASGSAPRDMEFFVTYAAIRSAVVMWRTTERQVHFGDAERPSDPDDMITHRLSLERMLDGSYWT
jgi:aminoglycoside phosphotransferase (APT) family kinase protein